MFGVLATPVAVPVVPEGGLPALNQGVAWMLYVGLVACVAALLYGGATWGLGALFGGQGGQSKGRTYVICGAVGSLVIGLSFVVLNGVLNEAVNSEGGVTSVTRVVPAAPTIPRR